MTNRPVEGSTGSPRLDGIVDGFYAAGESPVLNIAPVNE